MPEMADDVDETVVRDALEDAYRRKVDTNPNALELYMYANELPVDTPEDVAVSIAADVVADPPELEGQPSRGNVSTTGDEPDDEDIAAEPKTPKTTSSGWEKADFSTTAAGVYPPEMTEYGQWMIRGEQLPPYDRDKAPFAPWNESTKWGTEPNRIGFEDALNWDEKYPKSDGLVYIQTEADPFVFVDGDDVRCPETDDVHPAFVAVLEHLGMTYADVSTSGTGVHAYYRGTLPEDETVADWEIDDEPFGANDALPAIELYSGKHVCVTTGEHVDGTPTEVCAWDAEPLRPMLEANNEFTQTTETDTEPADTDTRPDDDPLPDDPTPNDCIKALNRLDAEDAAGKTIVKSWTDSSDYSGRGRAFLPSWGSSGDGGTANIVDSDLWTDTGNEDGAGGPVEMALIDMGEISHTESHKGYASGSEFWTGYEHLRDVGCKLPPSPTTTNGSDGDDDVSAYYDVDLGAYVDDGDPWADPDSMLKACLMARSEGAVSRDVEPPTLALFPIIKDCLGIKDANEVSAATQEQAEDVYLNELSRSRHVNNGALDL